MIKTALFATFFNLSYWRQDKKHIQIPSPLVPTFQEMHTLLPSFFMPWYKIGLTCNSHFRYTYTLIRCLLYGCLFCSCRLVISLWAYLLENNALELANQCLHYIRKYMYKPYNNALKSNIAKTGNSLVMHSCLFFGLVGFQKCSCFV